MENREKEKRKKRKGHGVFFKSQQSLDTHIQAERKHKKSPKARLVQKKSMVRSLIGQRAGFRVPDDNPPLSFYSSTDAAVPEFSETSVLLPKGRASRGKDGAEDQKQRMQHSIAENGSPRLLVISLGPLSKSSCGE